MTSKEIAGLMLVGTACLVWIIREVDGERLENVDAIELIKVVKDSL